jgi:hypothetical protein
MKRKRKSDKETDEVEDGGRAIVTDEALAAVVFSYADRHTYLDEIKVLDWQLLDLCHDLAEPFEVGKRSRYEWEQTILKTFEIWRKIQNHGGGGCDSIEKVVLRSFISSNLRCREYLRAPA